MASLRRYVVQLPLSLQPEKPLDVEQVVVVARELVDVVERPRRIGARHPVRASIATTQAALERLVVVQPVENLCEGDLALALNRNVNGWFREAVLAEHRRVPAPPDDRKIGRMGLSCS